MTIFVTRQLRVRLDSIRNSCDVLIIDYKTTDCKLIFKDQKNFNKQLMEDLF